jgi:hypothetical protein
MYAAIEAEAAAKAAYCIFTTPGAAAMYRERFPAAAERMHVLENGYDEESFASLPKQKDALTGVAGRTGPIVLLHSGIVYPSERDPTQLFAALQMLQRSRTLSPADVLIRFRAAEHDDLLRSLATQYGVQEFIELSTAIPYRQALAEMRAVGGLLVMQASNCNAQIPAKIYEYLRANRPVLGLTDPAGDTAGVLRDAGLHAIARLDSAQEIADTLPGFIQAIRSGVAHLPHVRAVRAASRQGRTEALAKLLDTVAAGGPGHA